MTKAITLITCFYKDTDFLRDAELQECLTRNINDPLIARIMLLVEEGAEGESVLAHPKVESLVVPKGRQTFADLIRVANERCGGEIVLLANTDIHFDQTLSFLQSVDFDQAVYISTRREVGLQGKSLWSYHQQASDAWALRAPIAVDNLEIELGKNGCESLFLGRLLRAGYRIENVSLDWKCYHMHASDKRNYKADVDRYTEVTEMAYPLISGRAPSRAALAPSEGPIVVDGAAFADGSPYAVMWREILREWQETPFGRDVVVLNRGGVDAYDISLTQVDAPPLNNYLISGVRQINGTLARRLGASLFLSTGNSTALGVPSVVMGTSAAPEVVMANLEKDDFARGLSFQMADAVLCAGADVREALEARYHHLGPSRFHLVPLWHGGTRVFACMRTAERNYVRRSLEMKERFVVFAGERVTAARTTNLKVVAEALRAMGNLGIVFIAGAATIEPEIQNLFQGISMRRLEEDDQEVLISLAAAEAFILPTLGSSESDWSHVALACGCPVVRAGWSSTHLHGEGTLFFSPTSTPSLVTVLEGIVLSERDRLGSDATARVTNEIRLSNAKRLAITLAAIRAGSPVPSFQRLLRDADPSSAIFRGGFSVEGWGGLGERESS